MKTMIPSFIIGFALVAMIGCSRGTEGLYAGHGEETAGWMTPVSLQNGPTAVYMGDYFLEPHEVDSVVWPSGLKASYREDSAVYRITGIPSTPLSVAHFWMDGARFDLLLKANGAQTVRFWYPGEPSDTAWGDSAIYLIGFFNNWDRAATVVPRADSGWSVSLALAPGSYEYKYVVNTEEVLDPTNGKRVTNGMGGTNNVLTVENEGENPRSLRTLRWEKEERSIVLGALPKGQSIYVFWENHLLPSSAVQRGANGQWHIRIPKEASSYQRSFIRVFTANTHQTGNDLLIPLEKGEVLMESSQLQRNDWESATLYFLMVDRFANGDPTNDKPLRRQDVIQKVDYWGGDLEGVSWAIQNNFFQNLGFNTVWLSPISRNPQGAWGYWDKCFPVTKFSAYHGYWPTSNTIPDARFATPEQVKNTLASAHNRNMNVLLDYIGNHVHQDHPAFKEHPEWFNSLYLPDSTLNTEKWDEYRLTTWFDVFLPDLNTEDPKVVEPMTDSALVWVRDYGFDGYRHDATKHVSNLYWRTLTKKIKHQVTAPQQKRVFQIGETYGSPELIASYLGSGLLDAQFDFNLYDVAVAFCGDLGADAYRLQEVLSASLSAYGHHHLMGNISGNQDRPRFISLASGDVSLSEDAKIAGYTRKIGTPSVKGYQKLALLHAFNFSIPGVPVVYYGDEWGMPGANDPDNRRLMKFKGYTPMEESLRKQTAQLATFRNHSPVMAYGSTRIKVLSKDILTVERSYFGSKVLTIINRSEKPLEFTVAKLGLKPKSRLEAGHAAMGTEVITVPALSFAMISTPR